MRINKKRKQLEEALRIAKQINDYIGIVKANRQLEELDRAEAEQERVTLSVATRHLGREEQKNISKAVIGCVVASDILQLQCMKLRQLTMRIPEYDVTINKQLKSIIHQLGDIVKVIDNTSKTSAPVNDNGRLIPLSEHYMEMVDKVEDKIYGWDNVISKIVEEHIVFTD